MKKRIALILTICLFILLFTSCKKAQIGEINAPSPVEVTTDEAGEDAVLQNEMEEILSEIEALKSTDGEFVRKVISAEGLRTVLDSGEDTLISLSTEKEEPIVIPAGDYSAFSLELDVKNGSFLSDGKLGRVILNAIGSPVILNDSVGALLLMGDDITADVNAGAGTVYLYGKNAVLNLNGGDFDTILTVNDTAVVNNHTGHIVTVSFENGARVYLKDGETMDYNQDTLR